VRLENALVRSDAVVFQTVSCVVRQLNPQNGEVTGHFELEEGVQIPRGLPNLSIEGPVVLEVKLLSSVITSQGSRRYRFVAVCEPEAIASLDLMMNAAKHPTILEDMMR
jgi:hypothetical protein